MWSKTASGQKRGGLSSNTTRLFMSNFLFFNSLLHLNLVNCPVGMFSLGWKCFNRAAVLGKKWDRKQGPTRNTKLLLAKEDKVLGENGGNRSSWRGRRGTRYQAFTLTYTSGRDSLLSDIRRPLKTERNEILELAGLTRVLRKFK